MSTNFPQFPYLENSFPNIKEELLNYGQKCYNYGIDTGLRPARQIMIWLTSDPPMDMKYLREMLQKEMDLELAKKEVMILK